MLPSYGVLIGTFDHSSEHQGRWLHALLYLKVKQQTYECAVDVNEPAGAFQFAILSNLNASLFQTISNLPDGYHPLQRTSTSGAIDYARSPILQPSPVTWSNVTGDEAGNALISMVSGSNRVFVFGAPYIQGLGMHDVHCNQGDPLNSTFHHFDAIWQDGCVFISKAGGALTAYLGKFSTQTLDTNDQGYPA
jgi:uncharacterized protein YukJ